MPVPTDATAPDRKLKLAAVTLAARLIADHAPQSLTGRAATMFLAEVTRDIPTEFFGHAENAAALRVLAKLCRDAICADPGGAGRWVRALQDLTHAQEYMARPEMWKATEANVTVARLVLGVDDGASIRVAFDADGQLIARQPDQDWRVVMNRQGHII